MEGSPGCGAGVGAHQAASSSSSTFHAGGVSRTATLNVGTLVGRAEQLSKMGCDLLLERLWSLTPRTAVVTNGPAAKSSMRGPRSRLPGETAAFPSWFLPPASC